MSLLSGSERYNDTGRRTRDVITKGEAETHQRVFARPPRLVAANRGF
jgi:hypothetical protein